MFIRPVFLASCLLLSCVPARAADTNQPSIRIGIVQMALARTIAENRDRIVSGIRDCAKRSVRVAVFPEDALCGEGDQALIDQSVNAIRDAAREQNIYVLFGGASYSEKLRKDSHWMFVIGPDGRDLLRYDKLYSIHDAKMPGTFSIDGIPCAAMLCADRWLRGVEEIPIQQGARISFELSCNFANEWVEPLGWYWYVPRALRNNVWVIFANTGNKVSGISDTGNPQDLRHGHSAVIAPNGALLANASDDMERIIIADLDLPQATRAEAQSRAANAVLRPFWEAGSRLQHGEKLSAPPLHALKSPAIELTVAAAQITNDFPAMEKLVAQARKKNADLIVFPERAIPISLIPQFQAAARENRITVVCGAERTVNGRRRNSAIVLGPEGEVLTSYDQISAEKPFEAGTEPGAMWFNVKGVPGIVTIGRDALWTELAELAAVAGAQIHVHLEHDADNSAPAALRRLQVWSTLATYQTFTVTANVVDSAIWDDLSSLEETRAAVRGLDRPDNGAIEVYSPFSADLIARAGSGQELILATRRVNKLNQHHPRRTSAMNPQMDAWYRLGANIIYPTRKTNHE